MRFIQSATMGFMLRPLAALHLGLTLCASAHAADERYSKIYHFGGESETGLLRYGVAVDAAGNIFGAADKAVFRLTPPVAPSTEWTLNVLHKFIQQKNSPDGRFSSGQVVIHAGSLYGTSAEHTEGNHGVAYRLRQSPRNGWVFRALQRFDGPQGTDPKRGILLGQDGTIYGTTVGGGAFNRGVLYKIDPGGVFSVLHTFDTPTGSTPDSNLVFCNDGAVYGTTRNGGGMGKFGVAFRYSDSDGYAVLHSFDGSRKSQSYGSRGPSGRIACAPNGTLYGATPLSGANSVGSIWSLAPGASGQTRTFSVLYSFEDYKDGFGVQPPQQPFSGVVLDPAGNLYGTATAGGNNNGGAFFVLNPPTAGTQWTFKVLHYLDGSAYNELLYHNGKIYGATFDSVFSYSLN